MVFINFTLSRDSSYFGFNSNFYQIFHFDYCNEERSEKVVSTFFMKRLVVDMILFR